MDKYIHYCFKTKCKNNFSDVNCDKMKSSQIIDIQSVLKF